MRDYVSFFSNRNSSDKKGVSECRDIDWWVEYFANRMAKIIFIILLISCFLLVKSFWKIGGNKYTFPIEHISLNGEILITKEKDIAAILKKMPESSFFEFDLNYLSTQLIEFPWIESVDVKRQWPNKLSINVFERKVSYRWGDDELLDDQGNRFVRMDHADFELLPKVEGVDGYENKVIDYYNQLLLALDDGVERLNVDKFVLNSYLSWELHLQSGLVVKFGRDNFSERLERFAHAYRTNKLPDMSKLKTIDFRYHKGFAVKWKSGFLAQPQIRDAALVKASHTDI